MDTVPLALRFPQPWGPTYSHQSELMETAKVFTPGPPDSPSHEEDHAETSGGFDIWRGWQATCSGGLRELGNNPDVHFPGLQLQNGGLGGQPCCLSWD